MGTLFNQRERGSHLSHWNEKDMQDAIFQQARRLEENHGIAFYEAMLVVSEERERQKFAYWKRDLDVKDEQLAGFGELLQELIHEISNLGE